MLLLFLVGYNVDAQERPGASEGTGPAEWSVELDYAAHTGDMLEVKRQLGGPADVDQQLRSTGNATPLIRAANAGHADLVRLLLLAGAGADYRTINGETALMRAAANGHVGAVGALVEASKPDLELVGYGQGFTALRMAAARGHGDVVRRLLEAGADADNIDTLGRSPLIFASGNGNVDAVKALLEWGAAVNLADANGRTAFETATKNQNPDHQV